MAQYYNFVTNASGTFTLEDVQRICCVNGQSVQFVVEDINSGSNGSQQVLTYTAAPQNNQQAIFSPQTVNLGSQIPAAQLEQGQNVLIIKTNEISGQQDIIKSSAVSAEAAGNNIANFVDNRGSKTLIDCNNGVQQIQWIKMQENSISLNTVSKQATLVTDKTQTAIINRNHIQNNISSPAFSAENTKRKPFRLHQTKNRQATNSIQTGSPSVASDGAARGAVVSSNVSTIGSNTPSFRNKAISSAGQNVTQISAQQAKLKQMQNSRQAQNDQRLQLSNAQRQASSVPKQSVPPSLTTLQRQRQQQQQQQHKQQQTPVSQLQRQQVGLRQTQSPHNMHSSMEVESSDYTGQERNSQQSSPTQTDCESNASESASFAYLQKMIDNPANTIVQHQIQGNTAKMLVILSNGEQRLITFDIPNEDCTVQDLLEQANIAFCGETTVSLVSDPTLGINYIVEAGAGSTVVANNMPEVNEANSTAEQIKTNSDGSSTSISSPDENSNPIQQNEEPIYVEGMLAVCSHCGMSSVDFNRCPRCKTKLPKDVKTVPMSMGMQGKKETGVSVDTFYKKNNERNSLGRIDRDSSMSKRGRGRGRSVTNKSRPIHKEPECLTISSDEDEDGKSKKGNSPNNSSFFSNTNNSFSDDMDTVLDKEPIITNNCVSNTDYSTDSEDSMKDNSMQRPQTALLCRTVRIGSYKYVPRERVCFLHNGIRFGVPLLEDETNFVTLDVKYHDIIRVLIYLGKTTPVLFIYTTPNSGARIRELLGMQDLKGPYYDPAGKDFTHKRITLLPEKMSEESKVVIKSLLSARGIMDELNAKEANELLMKASPRENSQMQTITTRRQSQVSSSLSSTSNSANGGIQTITVYPPPPAKGGIAINTEDYLCLGEDQFLNDVIIDFYLKYLTLEVLSDADQQRTHVFSSYFYKRLTSPHAQGAESNIPLSPAAKRHARVQKWTKNVNIFEKDFVIIPINEHAHWFLAIICFPGLVGKVSSNPSPAKGNDVQKTVQKIKKLKEVKLQAVTIGSTTVTPVATTITIDTVDDSSERDEAEGDDEEMEMDSDEDDQINEAQGNKAAAAVPEQNETEEKDTVKIPCILIFDSLAGASRARVVATLRDYLSCEHVAKIGTEKIFSKDTIKGASLKVPQQSNFTDCGLYVLQYVESFFKNPIKDYTLPIKTLRNWFEEIVVTRKREELSKLLIKLMNATKGDRSINLPVANFPTQDGKLKTKSENNVEMKSSKPEVENKKKPTTPQSPENRVGNNTPISPENSEQKFNIFGTPTFSPTPYSPSASSNSSESNQTEMAAEPTTPVSRPASETMSYLKAKRIAKLVRMDNHEQSQAAKKHKGEPFNSCK